MLKFFLKCIIFVSVMLITDQVVDAWLKKGLDRHYGFDNAAKILCVGHSRSDHGIDRQKLEHSLEVPVAKYAVAGVDTFDRLMMIRHYLSRHPEQPKIVVYDVDLFTFNGRSIIPGQKNDQYKQFFPFMDNAEVDDYVKKRSKWGEYTTRKLVKTLRYNDPSVSARAIINHFKTPQIPTTKIDMQEYQNAVRQGNDRGMLLVIDPEHVKCFEATMKMLRSRNIKVVLFYLPVIDLERRKIDLQYQERVVDMFRRYAAGDSGIYFMQPEEKYESSYELYLDPWHFNRNGQALITEDLSKVLKTMM